MLLLLVRQIRLGFSAKENQNNIAFAFLKIINNRNLDFWSHRRSNTGYIFGNGNGHTKESDFTHKNS